MKKLATALVGYMALAFAGPVSGQEADVIRSAIGHQIERHGLDGRIVLGHYEGNATTSRVERHNSIDLAAAATSLELAVRPRLKRCAEEEVAAHHQDCWLEGADFQIVAGVPELAGDRALVWVFWDSTEEIAGGRRTIAHRAELLELRRDASSDAWVVTQVLETTIS